MKVYSIKPQYDVRIPKVLEEGILYISSNYSIAVHLCACGCKTKCVTPLGVGQWILTTKGYKVTLRPSVLQRFECRSHYFITANKVEWF